MKLQCHPIRTPAEVHSIQASVERQPNDQLQIRFKLMGDSAKIHLPQSVSPQFRNELWQHTCFEMFIASESGSAYQEYNFSPSGEWAAYRFSDYRQRQGDLTIDDPQITRQVDAQSLSLSATLRTDALPTKQYWLIGLSAVVETDQGLSWWALNHSGKQPDFHSRQSFRMLLPWK